MHIHFSEEELAARRAATIKKMEEAQLKAMLIFRQETMFYLTGYDTFGYVFFQCLILGEDGRMTLLTRSADLRQAQHTSVIKDIRVWKDQEGAFPHMLLPDILDEYGARGKRIGIEWEAYGMTGKSALNLGMALDSYGTLTDASNLVSELRLVKSPAEIAYVRKAAELGDAALDAAADLAAPGVNEGSILAAMQGAVFEGGGDYPGNEFIIGSGQGALLCRYFTGRRTLDQNDQLTLEWAGVYRRYHAALMRTFVFGDMPQVQLDMYKAAHEALLACQEALKPGDPISTVFDAHARTLDAHGFQEHRLNACGYSLGTTFAPNWMDWPMFYEGNPVIARPNMVFFMHMILMNSEAGVAMTLGETVLVTETGCERLSKASLDLVHK
ncbi:MAG: Xaa-Pro peptidase family protein [Alphaproteobacteria bacterium]|nr:Xaa-Pro peptidase family protein [Alphaproteobacteria bacterium]